MGNAPLCTSQQAEGVGFKEYSYPDYMLVPGPSLRCLTDSPDLQQAGYGSKEGESVRARGVWWRDDTEVDPWAEERECDMILGLELLQDSVSSETHELGCLCTLIQVNIV